MDQPDRELGRQVIRGDEAAFRHLHGRHTPRLLRLARNLVGNQSMDPEELVQDVWVRAVASLGDFQWRSSLITWLSGILVNRVREEHRRRERTELIELNEDIEAWPPPPDPVDRMELERAMASLAPGARTVLVLHDIEGYTHEEIAEFLSISAGTSKSQLCRARRAMINHLGNLRKPLPYVPT